MPFAPGSYVAKGAIFVAGIKKADKAKDAAKAGRGAKKASSAGKRIFNVSKSKSKIWKKFKPVKGKSYRTSGKGKKTRYYEWDHTHNDIEMYNYKGKHLGSLDPITGKKYKGRVKGRKLNL